MAKRTRKTSKKKNNIKRKNVDKNIHVVVMIVISVLLGILIYKETGLIGKTLSPILGVIIGWIKYIIPIGTFVISIAYACDKKEFLSSKLLQYVIFIICICTLLSVYQISEGAIDIKDDISKVISDSYDLGTQNIGGGAIGTMIALPLVNMLGIAGTVVLTIGISLVILVFILGIPVSDIIEEFFENISENKQSRREEIEEYRQREYEERLKRREERRKTKRSIETSNKEEITDDQIKINLNNNDEKIKKYKHDKDDLIPLGAKKEEFSPNTIEDNLFKTQEEEKEDKTKEVLLLEHSQKVMEEENYEFPPIQLMSEGKGISLKGGKKVIADNATKLQKTLYNFGVSAKVENVSVGPAITRYELKPAEGVRVSKIANLADDIALNLAAESIRIEAPIPGKQAVGIEIPNKENEIVHLRDIIDSDKFNDSQSKLSFALGKDVAGEAVIADIAKMPHVLIAGSTGSGKSVCINTLITSIIYKSKPNEVKLLLVDPKVVELSVYNGIPHLLIPVVTDPKKAAGALAWAVQEMVHRYELFATKGVRDIKGYNSSVENEEEGKLPQIVIIIDELADLMMVAKNDVEDAICRLAQMARAAGMHLVIATQRPSVDVITGLIKANIPSRIAFAVSSQVDSRIILDMAGAEKLLGKGDMLFYPTGVSKPTRIQGAFISDKDVEKIVDFLKSNGNGPTYREDVIESIEKSNSTDKDIKDMEDEDDTDPLLDEAIETVIETRQASTSFIQRRFKVGYARAGRIIDQMEERGIISGYQGSKPREVLMSKERWQELNMQTSNSSEQTE